MSLIVAAVGRSGSGKTVTLEYLISRFSAEGYNIGVIKHIHHKNFTIDTEGKNTWRYAQAGAKVIAAISPNEVAIIKKTVNETGNIDQIMESMKKEKLDLIFIEGYHELVAKRADVSKILTAKDMESLQEILIDTVEPILAISGLIAKNPKHTLIQSYSTIDIPKDGEKLVELIKQQLTTPLLVKRGLLKSDQ
jgi:molybdopterin-guanine dinucleotide biosynthesis protein B